ncbi:uncharacterized protein [Lepeophtheirus salmonis]|nr:uncharacterized protein LOC121127371 [Lepeophtheirus salmonis]
MIRLFLIISITFSPLAKSKKSILSFGGNGNIGSEVLYQLISTKEYDDIYTVFRSGEWYFDNGERVAPKVTYLSCDRAKDPPCPENEDPCDINSLKLCPDLFKIMNKTEFDIVLDFSAYEPKWIRDVLGLLKLKEDGVYIYISTDSVYEVSKPKTSRRPSVETDAVRPDDFKIRDQLKNSDMYGHSKLAGEEVLKEQNSVNWVSLRLADVIGPRDTTRRLWLYILWIKFYSSIQEPIFIPPEVKGVDESVTYVKDVGRVVLSVIDKGPSVWNEAYNVALEGTFTLESIITKTAETLNVSSANLEFDRKESDRSFHLFPTVYGGSMSIQKAKTILNFEPTDIDEAFRDTIDWCLETFINDEIEREEMTTRLLTYVVPGRSNSKNILEAMDKYLADRGIWTRRYQQSKRGDTGDIDDILNDKNEL